jgi:hypothetical protein
MLKKIKRKTRILQQLHRTAARAHPARVTFLRVDVELGSSFVLSPLKSHLVFLDAMVQDSVQVQVGLERNSYPPLFDISEIPNEFTYPPPRPLIGGPGAASRDATNSSGLDSIDSTKLIVL